MTDAPKTPHRLYLALGATIVLVLSLGIGIGIYELIQIARNLDRTAAASSETLAMVNGALKGKHANGDDGYLVLGQRLLQNATGAANALKQTMQDANKIAKEQEPKTAALTDASVALMTSGQVAVAKLGTSIDSLDGAIADVRKDTLPRLNAGVDALNGLVSDLRPTATASTELVQATTADIVAIGGTVNDANVLLQNPDLPMMLHSFAEASAELVSIENHLNGTAADVQLGVHNIFNPKKTTFLELVAITAARSVLGAAAGPVISHFWPLRIDIANTVPVVVK